MYIGKLNEPLFFITLNPYFKKIEPDKDYKWTVKNFPYIFTPSLGVGITNINEDIKPIYFAGIGCRVNKVIRFSIDGNYYSPIIENSDTKGNYEWALSFGATISVNYISDLLKLITAAQANLVSP